MKKGFYLMVLIIFSGCGNSLENLTKQPEIKELSGEWKLDQISYTAMLRYSYRCSDVRLTLNEDGSFEAENFPNVMNELTTEQYANCQTIQGEWSIEKRFTIEKWAIVLRFDEKQIYGENNLILFDLYTQNKKLILRHSFEEYKDSDSDKRLQFFKM
nr:hypothetical protein [uncultured Flavobacterium sp.]